MYVDSEHLAEWLSSGRLRRGSVEFSSEFDSFLCGLPWLPSRVNWSSIPNVTFNYEKEGWSGELALQWALKNGFDEFEYVFLMYSASEPGLICSTSDAFVELDFLTMGRVHPAYLCGIRQEGGAEVIHVEKFAEWDGFSVLVTRS